MENTYGISVDNRYELFYIDDEATDPLEALVVKKKTPKEKVKERKGTAEKENKSATINKQERRAKVAPPIPTHPKEAHVVRINKCPSPDVVEKKNRRNREVERLEEKPRRRRFETRQKREFDRQSGSDKTGVKSVDKREGAGAHNWGSHKEVIDEIVPKPALPDWSENETRPQESQEVDDSANQTSGQEEETKELTLDEYKALRAGKSKPPQYNLRKAGEGEDISQWQEMVALEAKRRVGDDDAEGDAASYQQRATRQKHILDIEFHFNDSRRAGQLGRGMRGRTRPSTNRQITRNRRSDGEERERLQRSDQPRLRDEGLHAAPKVDDEKDFPSLGLLNTSLVRHSPKVVPMFGKDDTK
ncbi:SERPINE1 mRNA-binding protein 1-like [Phlebotomus argentipes]|uniref:SERPINE1 mRNA-binding protein 1-like n=1 Tax=Phlebotomus argentipes TaxID=94469 RepID=UPI00289298BC|nr:SERPINE1 mRNA-binding protein 1-like [Phlebotomus argentipes]